MLKPQREIVLANVLQCADLLNIGNQFMTFTEQRSNV